MDMVAVLLNTPLDKTVARRLAAGDSVSISGKIYAARDEAHKRLVEAISHGDELPFPVEGSIIFYAGPTPPRPGEVIGSIGPTTSYRMDAFTPQLIAAGVRGMIGKGPRGNDVVEAMINFGAVYFAATGGTAALLARTVKSSVKIAFEELGPEALFELKVEGFPSIVAQDSRGENLFEKGKLLYAKNL